MTAAQESFYIQQFKLGDNNSFQILYQHYHKRIINYGKSHFPYNEDDVKMPIKMFLLHYGKQESGYLLTKLLTFISKEV